MVLMFIFLYQKKEVRLIEWLFLIIIYLLFVGHVKGGHLLKGSLIRTTAEVVFAVLDSQYHFTREFDKNTGWNELVVHPKK